MSGNSNPAEQRYYFVLGTQSLSVSSGQKVSQWVEWQKQYPVQIASAMNGTIFYWWFQNEFWSVSENLTRDEVMCLINEQNLKFQRRISKAKAATASVQSDDVLSRSRAIPQEVKLAVWQRDSGQCVQCKSNKNLEFDHIIPFSLGRSHTERNIQVLCEECNRSKGAGL